MSKKPYDTGEEVRASWFRGLWGAVSVLLAGVIVLWVISTMFFRYWENRVIQRIKAGVPAAEWNDFIHWQQKPLPFPNEYWEIKPPLPLEVTNGKQKLFEDFRRLYNKLEWLRPDTRSGNDPLFRKIIAQGGLTTSDTLLLEQFNSEMPQLVERSVQLMNHPEYVLNDRIFYSNGVAPKDTAALALLEHYAYLLCLNENWTSVIICLEPVLGLVKTDRVGGKGVEYARKITGMSVAKNTTSMVMDGTSDTRVLRQLQACLQAGRPVIADVDSDVLSMDLPVLAEQQLLRLGLIDHPSRTYGELMETYAVNISRLSRKLIAEVPASDLWRIEELDNFVFFEMPVNYFRDFRGPLQPIGNRLTRIYAVDAALNYKQWHEKVVGIFRNHLALYDLSMIGVVQRISELEGRAMSEILPRNPGDSYKPDSPYKLNESRNEFFSVGPDGMDGTADDIYLQNWLLRESIGETSTILAGAHP